MPRILILIVAALSLTIPVARSLDRGRDTDSVSTSVTLDSLNRMDSRDLVAEGVKGIESNRIKDAFAPLSIAANRYYSNSGDSATRRYGSEAMRHLANIYMSYDIDYRKAYRYLKLARQIAEEDGNNYDLCFIYMSLVNLYSMNGDIDDENSRVIHKFIEDGVRLAIKSGNDIALSCFLVDIAIMIGYGDDIDPYRKIVEMASRYRSTDDSKYKQTSKYKETSEYILSGLSAYFSKYYVEAEREFINASEGLEGLRFGERLYLSINIFLIKLYRTTGQAEKATALSRSLLDYSEENGYRDYELSMNHVLYDIYKSEGISDSAEYYHNRYLRLAETLENENGYGSVRTLDFMSEIETINKEVENLSIKRQKQQKVQIIIVFALCLLILVIAALLWNYITLKRNHRTLFNRNEEMTRQSVIYGMMRRKWEEEKKELESLLAAERERSTVTESVSPESQQLQQPETIGQDCVDCDKEEYEQMQKLFTRIVDVMESSEDIYKQKFALNDLASIVGVPSRLVSKAINMCYNSNFHQFLIDYRIREVSRLMHDPSMRNMTIESLAERAGFSSRTYFATVFKKSTGLTPSEYLKMGEK